MAAGASLPKPTPISFLSYPLSLLSKFIILTTLIRTSVWRIEVALVSGQSRTGAANGGISDRYLN
jgi:hypothetical protein